MSITYGFFNSVSGDRVYNADTISHMFNGLLSDGVYQGYEGGFKVSPSSGLTLSVASGRAIVHDRWAENDAAVTITLDSANAALPRWDAIVLEKDVTNRNITLKVLKGTAASSPVKPTPNRNTAALYDLLLAYVYVGAGATAITSANIEDQRSGAYCGWVTGLVNQVDTSTLFTQFMAAYQDNLDDMEAWEAAQKAAFDAWFNDLQSDLNVDTYVEKYEGTVVTDTAGQTVISLPFTSSEFASGDILEVYANGLRLPNEAYSVDVGDLEVTLAAAMPLGQVFHFVVLKSVIGVNP